VPESVDRFNKIERVRPRPGLRVANIDYRTIASAGRRRGGQLRNRDAGQRALELAGIEASAVAPTLY
jgi:hypothetical protein